MQTLRRAIPELIRCSCWLWLGLGLLLRSFFMNGLYALVPVGIWCSPLGIRALCKNEPFHPSMKVPHTLPRTSLGSPFLPLNGVQ